MTISISAKVTQSKGGKKRGYKIRLVAVLYFAHIAHCKHLQRQKNTNFNLICLLSASRGTFLGQVKLLIFFSVFALLFFNLKYHIIVFYSTVLGIDYNVPVFSLTINAIVALR